MRDRWILARAVTVVGGAALVLFATTAPALAATPETWAKKPKMPWLEVLGIYAGIPLALFGIITVLVLLPSLMRGPHYRPGQPWSARPQWFGGPVDADRAGGTVGQLPPGSGPENPVHEPPPPPGEPADFVVPARKGGASARW